MAAPIDAQKILARLAQVGEGPAPVVTCYLKLEPRDRAHGKYAIKIKNRIKRLKGWLDEQRLPREENGHITRDLDRIYEYVADSTNLPPGRGIAIFACGRRRLFDVIPLPLVYRSRLAVNRRPLVREVAAIADDFGLVHATVFDRTAARFFRVTAFGIEELSAISAGDTMRAKRFHGVTVPTGIGAAVASFGEHNYQQRMRHDKHRHYDHIADALLRLDQAQPARGILVGSVGGEAKALEPFLHRYLRGRVLGPVKLNPKTAQPTHVFEAAIELRLEQERAQERELAATLDERMAQGLAVNGIQATLGALAYGQVHTLILDPDAQQPGFRCPESGRLTLNTRLCRGEGEPMPVADVVDEALEDALEQRAVVEVVFDPSARSRVDGLAALLRFKR